MQKLQEISSKNQQFFTKCQYLMFQITNKQENKEGTIPN